MYDVDHSGTWLRGRFRPNFIVESCRALELYYLSRDKEGRSAGKGTCLGRIVNDRGVTGPGRKRTRTKQKPRGCKPLRRWMVLQISSNHVEYIRGIHVEPMSFNWTDEWAFGRACLDWGFWLAEDISAPREGLDKARKRRDRDAGNCWRTFEWNLKHLKAKVCGSMNWLIGDWKVRYIIGLKARAEQLFESIIRHLSDLPNKARCQR